jgi:conjugal transfer pilus assembly protein TraV
MSALGEAPLSRQSGLAVWRLAIRLGDLAARRSPSPVARAASIAVIGLAATQLAACTSLFGGNIKGSFACSAPGGTCAPSTVIDDQALSVIQNARPMTPAGPYIRQPAAARPVTASYTPSGSGRLTSAGGGMVHRERRVLKVVFPSFVDGGGNLHEPRIVHAVVDDGAWMELSSGEPNVANRSRAVRSASRARHSCRRRRRPPRLPRRCATHCKSDRCRACRAAAPRGRCSSPRQGRRAPVGQSDRGDPAEVKARLASHGKAHRPAAVAPRVRCRPRPRHHFGGQCQLRPPRNQPMARGLSGQGRGVATMASRGFWDRFLDMLFGESAHPEAERPVLGAPMLSNWLPYRSFDKKSRMFINTDSVGFILELAPMMGADERSGELLTQFLSDAVPSGCEIQLIHWQSPSVGERIADWVMPRVVAKGVYGRAAMHRARWLRRGAWMSISRMRRSICAIARVILIGARLSGPIGADMLVDGARQPDGHTAGALDPGARHGPGRADRLPRRFSLPGGR